MILFPWIALSLTLALLTMALLEAPEAGRNAIRERRVYAHRPAARLLIALVAAELALIVIWALTVAGPDR